MTEPQPLTINASTVEGAPFRVVFEGEHAEAVALDFMTRHPDYVFELDSGMVPDVEAEQEFRFDFPEVYDRLFPTCEHGFPEQDCYGDNCVEVHRG